MNLGTLIKESVAVFRTNYILAVPTVVGVFLVAFVSLLVVSSPEETSRIGFMFFVSLVVIFFTMAVTSAMAGEVLQEGGTSVRSAATFLRHMWASAAGASLIAGLILFIGFMLFILPGLAISYFLMFMVVSLAVERAGPMEALRLSIAVVRGNPKDSFMLFVALLTGWLVLAVFNMLFQGIPVLGPIVSVLLTAAFVGVASVVLVRAYLELAGTHETVRQAALSPEPSERHD
jgi:hypothetical protein